MEFADLNRELTRIVELRNELQSSNGADEDRKELEFLESGFVEKYGFFLEEALRDVHDEICPDDQVKPLTQYLADQYIDTGNKRGGMKVFEVENDQGVEVGVDDYPGLETKLVILPNPCRIMLIVGEGEREELWRLQGN